MSSQPGILAPLPTAARSILFSLKPEANAGSLLATLLELESNLGLVVGLGPECVARLGGSIDGLREPQVMVGPAVSTPATPAALWCWLRGNDRGVLLHESQQLTTALADCFELESVLDLFTHRTNRDLTGYEDGTENPEGDAAIRAALVRGSDSSFAGSSFVAVQPWTHDLRRFRSFTESARDQTIGRRIADNTEIDDAPASAHVKRTAQETFSPEAFVLRRSMPWAAGNEGGLLFMAFGHSFNAFEALMARMVGVEDGITDALFSFSKPNALSYFWCPPLRGESLDLQRFTSHK